MSRKDFLITLFDLCCEEYDSVLQSGHDGIAASTRVMSAVTNCLAILLYEVTDGKTKLMESGIDCINKDLREALEQMKLLEKKYGEPHGRGKEDN